MPRRDGNTQKPRRLKHRAHRATRRTRPERAQVRLERPDQRFIETLGRNPYPAIHALIVRRVAERREEEVNATAEPAAREPAAA